MVCCLAAPSLFGAKPLPVQVEGPVIWNVIRPCCVTVKTKLQNAISVLQMIKHPVRECGGLLYYYPGHAVERTAERLVFGNIMKLMWRHCNNNAISILQMITSPVRVWMSHWFRWFVACSALSHYLNQLKDRWFETSWRPCCVTVITMLQNAISVLQMITSPMRECEGLLCY